MQQFYVPALACCNLKEQVNAFNFALFKQKDKEIQSYQNYDTDDERPVLGQNRPISGCRSN
jgi:hypothetical protein